MTLYDRADNVVTRHADKYDTILTWCGAEADHVVDSGYGPVDASCLYAVNCLPCLAAIEAYGAAARTCRLALDPAACWPDFATPNEATRALVLLGELSSGGEFAIWYERLVTGEAAGPFAAWKEWCDARELILTIMARGIK